MNSSQKQCPGCNGELKPAADQSGLLECSTCHTIYSPNLDDKKSFGDALASALIVFGKILLILGGIVLIVFGILFAGCLFSGSRL